MGTLELFSHAYCAENNSCVLVDAWLALFLALSLTVSTTCCVVFWLRHTRPSCWWRKVGIQVPETARPVVVPLAVIERDAGEAEIRSHKNSLKQGEQFVEKTQRMSRASLDKESNNARSQRKSIDRDSQAPTASSRTSNNGTTPRGSFSKTGSPAMLGPRFQMTDMRRKSNPNQRTVASRRSISRRSSRASSEGASPDERAAEGTRTLEEGRSASFRHKVVTMLSSPADFMKRRLRADPVTSFESPTYEQKQELATLPAESRTQNERRSSMELRDRRRLSIGMNSRLQFQIGGDKASVYEIKLKEINLVKRLAYGPLSEVYAAIWRDTKVGVKILMPKEGYVDHLEEAVRNFRREIWVMNSLKHPNLVKLIGASLTPRCYVLVMEYMSNGSLYEYLRDEANFMPAQMIITCAFDIAAGMAHIHACGVMQRDLKSKNCLLSENLIVKVSDFGLARFKSKLHGEYTFVGTPFWAAPEVIRHENYDEKADVYSYAIVLWELVERVDPYHDLNAFQVPLLVANEGLRPAPFTQQPPLGLEQLMKQCWDANPDQRPTFIEISATLEKWLSPTSPLIERSLEEDHLNAHILRERNTATEEELNRFATSHNANEKVIPIVLSSRMSEKVIVKKRPSVKRTGSDMSNLVSKAAAQMH
ncbi:TPA: hypothetical protein N0F65_000909 [Lagenidium giganteum]|uniref:Protein kinase domain-containing protein n=1 Tax=Lagenidium giganteum TaxID=4803 RepID=A0AAV2YK68_9STRA|nr:TPA: hypothetical protein N0F65_000909 [Lagenidium giganteum]